MLLTHLRRRPRLASRWSPPTRCWRIAGYTLLVTYLTMLR